MTVENQTEYARVLILEPDQAAAWRMAAAFMRPCCLAERLRSQARTGSEIVRCKCGDESPDSACSVVVGSLKQLHSLECANFDVVICALCLPDGSGLDALAYLRGMYPGLPVLLTGGPADAAIAVEAIRAGAMDFLITAGHDLRTLPLSVEKCLTHQRIRQENDRLQHDLGRSLNDLEVKNKQLEAVIRQLEAMARTDDLTGLANRRWLNLMLEGSWAEATRHDVPLACMMIDLDGFKNYNDRMGHQRGDEILHLAGKVIEANSRSIDICARYGGDEFCIVMPHTEAQEAVQVAARILREFAGSLQRRSEAEPPVGISIGISQVDLSRPVSSDHLLMHADEALYAAKAGGKNRVVLRGAAGRFLEPDLKAEVTALAADSA